MKTPPFLSCGVRWSCFIRVAPLFFAPVAAAQTCPIVDCGSPTDGVTTISVIEPPSPCAPGEPWTDWNRMLLQSDAIGASYQVEVRWNRVGLPYRGCALWMMGRFGTTFHRENAGFAAGAQDSLDLIDQVRTIEVKYLPPGLGLYPRIGFPNLSAIITDVWEHLVAMDIAGGVRVHVGSSAGSMQGSNALAYHGLKEIVDGVVFGGGPFWTDLEETCLDPGSPLYAPDAIRRSVDVWSYEQTNGSTPCQDLTATPDPTWTCRSTLGVDADVDYADEIVAVIVGVDDLHNPWMDAAAWDYYQTITALAKSFDRPLAGHTIWTSTDGAQVGLMRIRQIVDTFRPTGIEIVAIPEAIRVFPNPFSTATHCRFHLPEGGRVQLRIFDVAGRAVRTLVDASIAAGSHERTWNGADEHGRPLPAGVYFQRVDTPGGSFTRKLTLLR